MINMESKVKNLYTDFDVTSDNNAVQIASLVRKLKTKATEFPENMVNLYAQDKRKRTRTSFAKRILCSLKIS
jgi:hypothetical protein